MEAISKVKFNISDANTAQACLEEMIKSHKGWSTTLNKKDAKVIYLKPSADDEEIMSIASQKGKVINRYPGAKDLSHKDNFSKQMKICMDINPEAYDFVPPTFIWPEEEKRLKEYMKKNPGCCYIGKP